MEVAKGVFLAFFFGTEGEGKGKEVREAKGRIEEGKE